MPSAQPMPVQTARVERPFVVVGANMTDVDEGPRGARLWRPRRCAGVGYCPLPSKEVGDKGTHPTVNPPPPAPAVAYLIA